MTWEPLRLTVERESVTGRRAFRQAPGCLLYLHGSPGSSADLSLEFLRAWNFRTQVVAFDRPGYGGSSSAVGLSLSRMGNRLVEAFQQLDTLRPRFLVAHSWSSCLALQMIADQPDVFDGVILVGPYVFPESGAQEKPLLLRWAQSNGLGWWTFSLLIQVLGRRILNSFLRKAFSPDPIDLRYQSWLLNEWFEPRNFITLFDERRAMRQQDVSEILKSKSFDRVRIQVIEGDCDEITPREKQVDPLTEMRAVRLEIMKKRGHMIPLSSPVEFAARLAECLVEEGSAYETAESSGS